MDHGVKMIKIPARFNQVVGCQVNLPSKATQWTIGMALASMLVLITGCTVGPKYHRPAAPVAAAYKELYRIHGSKHSRMLQFPAENGGRFTTILH